jgi:hypothetical protein
MRRRRRRQEARRMRIHTSFIPCIFGFLSIVARISRFRGERRMTEEQRLRWETLGVRRELLGHFAHVHISYHCVGLRSVEATTFVLHIRWNLCLARYVVNHPWSPTISWYIEAPALQPVCNHVLIPTHNQSQLIPKIKTPSPCKYANAHLSYDAKVTATTSATTTANMFPCCLPTPLLPCVNASVGRLLLPTAFVTPFASSTLAIAGPMLVQSVKTNVGGLP